MWDFILPNEEQQEALPVSTSSKNTSEATQPNQKQKYSMPTKDKTVSKKSTTKAMQTNPTNSDVPPTRKAMVVFDTNEYNVVEDMKKVRAKISIHELNKLKQQQNILLRDLNVDLA